MRSPTSAFISAAFVGWSEQAARFGWRDAYAIGHHAHEQAIEKLCKVFLEHSLFAFSSCRPHHLAAHIQPESDFSWVSLVDYNRGDKKGYRN